MIVCPENIVPPRWAPLLLLRDFTMKAIFHASMPGKRYNFGVLALKDNVYETLTICFDKYALTANWTPQRLHPYSRRPSL
jgi:hypothetical protein